MKSKIYKAENKEDYFDLLLIADEQRELIERYLKDGTMFVLDNDGVKGEIVVCDAGSGVLEIKNLAVFPEYRHCGYGRELIAFVCNEYKNRFSSVQVGTGDSPLTVPFYEKCGFIRSHTVKNFFTDNYDHIIVEDGVVLKDMIYLKRKL